MMRQRIVSIGECMLEISSVGASYGLGFAGDTLNTAWYMRRALSQDWKVDYLTALGDDRYSADMRSFLERNGIGTKLSVSIPGHKPGLYIIHQVNGDRHFTYWRETSAARKLADDPVRLAAALNGVGLIYLSGITLAILPDAGRKNLLSALSVARQNGAMIAFDPNIRPALWPNPDVMSDVMEGTSRLAHVVMPTFGDEKAAFGDASPEETAFRYRLWGAETIVVKNGGDPAFVLGQGASGLSVPAVPARIVDATGAGDSFNGAFLAAMLLGDDLLTSCEQAHRQAAEVLGVSGALVVEK